MADLILAADVQTALSSLDANQLADLPAAISAASSALERECRRGLALASYDKLYRPGRRRKIYLDTCPVLNVRLRTENTAVMTVTNTDIVTNQAATVTRSATSLTLWRMASGVPTSNVLTLSSYLRVTDLAVAVNAIGGGWVATVQGTIGGGFTAINCGLIAVSELSLDFETQGALNQNAELRSYLRDINRYELRNTTNFAVLELTENLPEQYRYADRAYGQGYGSAWAGSLDPRYANVRALYTGGYAVQLADLAAGIYPPMPEAIKRAMVFTVQAILDTTQAPQVQSESDGTLSNTLDGSPMAVPRAALNLIGPYIRPRV